MLGAMHRTPRSQTHGRAEARRAPARNVARSFALLVGALLLSSCSDGSTSLDGKVIDVPVVKRARALLELAEVDADS